MSPSGNRAASIGIRQLKAELSRQLRRVEAGESLAVTDRGRVIATISPATQGHDSAIEWARAMVAGGKATWAGGKPLGARHPARTTASAGVADAVIEDRR
jgi:antitoxin (DNA-binding transcriptional repressor) of toxin-antitoxin stability system